jgi:dephospho-CoA kinase
MPACGKDTALEVVRGRFPVFRMGDVVMERLRAEGREVTADSVGALAGRLREEHGKGAVALLLAERLRTLSDPVVVINGVRGVAEVQVFRRMFPRFALVAVHSSPETRFRRVLDRQREDDATSRARFEEKDSRELGWGLGEAIALADVMLVNEGTREELAQRFEEVLRRLGAGGESCR